MDKHEVLSPDEEVVCEFKAKPDDDHRRATVLCTPHRLIVLRRNKYATVSRRAVDVVEVERASEVNLYTLAGGALLVATGLLAQSLPQLELMAGGLALGAALIGAGLLFRTTTLTVSTGSQTYTLTTRDHDAADTAAKILRTPYQSSNPTPRHS